jgi:cysteine-rich repeat protein
VRATLSAVHDVRFVMRLLAIVVFVVAGSLTTACIRPKLTDCGDGRACPAGTLCVSSLSTCATPAQLAACTDRADETPCEAGAVVGACFAGVCLPAGCGNGIVESTELCDDGNERSDDGCRADCQSDEVCGNAIVDTGEKCDDGNLLSRDGCDSRCAEEQLQWTVYAVAPALAPRYITAFDEARGKVITVTSHLVWEWDGQTWTATRSSEYIVAVYYDPDRGRVQALAGGVPRLVEWTGTTWVTRIAPMPSFGAAAFDRARHRAILIGSSQTFVLSATNELTTLDGVATSQGTLAYDEVEDDIVFVAWDGREFVFTDIGWTQTSTLSLAESSTLLYHRGRGALWLVSGAVDGTSAVRERVGGSWTDVANTTLSTVPRIAVYDSQRDVVVACCGALADIGLVHEWGSTTSWTTRSTRMPAVAAALAPEPDGIGFIAVGGQGLANTAWNNTWRWDGAWQHLDNLASPPPDLWPYATYDPVRGAVIAYGVGARTETWAYDGTQWMLLASEGPQSALAITYDPEARQPLTATTELSDEHAHIFAFTDQNAWIERPMVSLVDDSQYVTSLAWSARARTVSMTTEQGKFYDAQSGAWVPVPSLGSEWIGVTNVRTGGIIYVPFRQLGSDAQVWERRDTTWRELTAAPWSLTTGRAAYNPRTGRLLVQGSTSEEVVTFVAEMTNGSPLESCPAGAALDDDGDGLAGCADPDCWWACAADCPPYTSCSAL